MAFLHLNVSRRLSIRLMHTPEQIAMAATHTTIVMAVICLSLLNFFLQTLRIY